VLLQNDLVVAMCNFILVATYIDSLVSVMSVYSVLPSVSVLSVLSVLFVS
jgi:hypothetical protein